MRLADIEETLSARFSNGFSKLSDLPYPNLLKDSVKASQRIIQAIQNKEKITIIGDYDVDGVTSSAITHLFFKEIGVDVEIIIPNRFSDGYGITPQLLNRVDADLVITVDNGIHSFQSAEILKKRKTDLIITDHHQPSDKLPDAFAIVNPKQIDCEYPYKDICGAEVIWLLLAQVKQDLKSDIDMGQFLDLLAIAIIADIMPITEFNHSLVKVGLKKFFSNNRISNKVLINNLFSQKNHITSEDVAFQISPRLNSSGRMKDAILSFNFLISDNYFEANELFDEINELNQNRKIVERDITKQVIDEIDSSKPIILYYHQNLHSGVIGIVASRIVEKFHKPAIIFALENGILKGSGRSLGNIDIFKILQNSQKLFIKWGGHKMAGGLSLELSNFDKFKNESFAFMKNYISDDFKEKNQNYGELDIQDINLDLFTTLDKFEPFGNQNKKPIFTMLNSLVKSSHRIGKDKQFQKILVEKNSIELEVLIFSDIEDFIIGDIISFSYRPVLSTFRNKKTTQAFLISILFDK